MAWNRANRISRRRIQCASDWLARFAVPTHVVADVVRPLPPRPKAVAESVSGKRTAKPSGERSLTTSPTKIQTHGEVSRRRLPNPNPRRSLTTSPTVSLTSRCGGHRGGDRNGRPGLRNRSPGGTSNNPPRPCPIWDRSIPNQRCSAGSGGPAW